MGKLSTRFQHISEPYAFFHHEPPYVIGTGKYINKLACWTVAESNIEMNYENNIFIINHLSTRQCAIECRLKMKNIGTATQIKLLTFSNDNLKQECELQKHSTCSDTYACDIYYDDLNPSTNYNLYYSITENDDIIMKCIPMLTFTTKPHIVNIVTWKQQITNGTYSINVNVNDDNFCKIFRSIRFQCKFEVDVRNQNITQIDKNEYCIKCELFDLKHNDFISPIVEWSETGIMTFDNVSQLCRTVLNTASFQYTSSFDKITLLFENEVNKKHIFVNGDLISTVMEREYNVCGLKENKTYQIRMHETDDLGNKSNEIVKQCSTKARIVYSCACNTNHATKLAHGHELKNMFFKTNFEIDKMNVILKSPSGVEYFRWDNVRFTYDQKTHDKTSNFTYHVLDALNVVDNGNKQESALECFIDTETCVQSLKKVFFYEQIPRKPIGELMMIPKNVRDEEIDVQIIRYNDEIELNFEYAFKLGFCIDLKPPDADELIKYVDDTFKMVTLNNLLPDTHYKLIYEISNQYMLEKTMKESFRFKTKPNESYGILHVRKNGMFRYPLKIEHQDKHDKQCRKHMNTCNQLPYYQDIFSVKKGSIIVLTYAHNTIYIQTTKHTNHYMLSLKECDVSTKFSYRFFGFKYTPESSILINKDSIREEENIIYA